MNLPLELIAAPLPSTREMAAWDKAAIGAGTAGLELMERAGNLSAEQITRFLKPGLRDTVLVLCGPGNNGGDGLVIARVLKSRGLAVVVLASAAARYSDDFLANAARLVDAGGEIGLFGADSPAPFKARSVSLREVQSLATTAAVIVDALLGTGRSGSPDGAIRELLEAVCPIIDSTRVVSIDIPTGIDGDTGAAIPCAITAAMTIAVQALKRGCVQYPARSRVGAVETIDIGISSKGPAEFSLLSSACLRLPQRDPAAHKGHFGHVFVVGGSAAMPGAPILAAAGALRLGAGRATFAAIDGVSYPELPEALRLPLPSRAGGALLESDGAAILAAHADSPGPVVLGPGLGLSRGGRELVHALIKGGVGCDSAAIIDADALTILSELHAAGGLPALRKAVLTPHPGEAARLLGSTTQAVQADRYGAARAIAKRYGGVVVLKGATSVVYGEDAGFVTTAGTPFLATPGSGDVLSGLIGALAAHGFSLLEAACRGTVIHATAGEVASAHSGGPILASDIVQAVPHAISFRGLRA